MAKRKLAKGTCRIIHTKAGRRKICKARDGKVRFAKLGKVSRKRKATKRRKRR